MTTLGTNIRTSLYSAEDSQQNYRTSIILSFTFKYFSIVETRNQRDGGVSYV